MRKPIAILLLLVVMLVLGAFSARAQPLVAELGQNTIRISTAFSGESVLVFGAIDGPGDIVVIARSAPQLTVVRKKVRVLGVWVNGDSASFASLPAFYALAATRPPAEIMDAGERRGAVAGIDMLPLLSRGSQDPAFRHALVRLRQENHLYDDSARVELVGERLFHARLAFPGNVSAGEYRVEVLLVREGRIAARQELPLHIRHAGFAAQINEIAREQPALYGIGCIVLAALAGWLGAFLFRRS